MRMTNDVDTCLSVEEKRGGGSDARTLAVLFKQITSDLRQSQNIKTW